MDVLANHVGLGEPCALVVVDALAEYGYSIVALSDVDAEGVRLHTDPWDTEEEAAVCVLPRSGTQRRHVLDAIHNSSGLTDMEIAEELGMVSDSARARRNELMNGGWIQDSGNRRGSGHGGQAIVWVLSPAGRVKLNPVRKIRKIRRR